jgi:DNA-binding response OmpR family regulator
MGSASHRARSSSANHAARSLDVLVLIEDQRERARVELALAPLGPALRATRDSGRAALVVLDAATPIAALRREHPAVPLLVLLPSRAGVARVLDGGADGVLDRGLRPAELRARVRALLRRAQGTVSGAPAVAELGTLRIDFRTRSVWLADLPLALTPGEHALLACLASDPGRVFTKAELRCRCAGEYSSRSRSRSLETRVARLRRRLDSHGSMLVTVWGVGYLLLEPR